MKEVLLVSQDAIRESAADAIDILGRTKFNIKLRFDHFVFFTNFSSTQFLARM